MTPYMTKKLSVIEEQIFNQFKTEISSWKKSAVFAGGKSIYAPVFRYLAVEGSLKEMYSIYTPLFSVARSFNSPKQTAYSFGFNLYQNTEYRDMDNKLFPFYALGFNVRQRLVAEGLLLAQ